MTNDLISREALQETFTEECCGCCDNCPHCLTGYKCDLIDNAPTVESTFTREELKAWLYAIAINNLDGLERDKIFALDCEEIIGRLDGFERFVKDRREGKE